VLISYLMGWILASEVGATPLLSSSVEALAFEERKRVGHCI